MAHLYLYDLDSGELKSTVTKGEWCVRDVLGFDSARREAFIQTGGRVSSDATATDLDRDPYYRDIVRVHVDTGEIETVISSNHDYNTASSKNMTTMTGSSVLGFDAAATCAISGSGNFVVTSRSRADEPSQSLLLTREGELVLELEKSDLSALPNDWRWPEPEKLLAADGKTDIYGLVFRPSHFSPDRSYPVISHTFNVPEGIWVSKGSFGNGNVHNWAYLDAAAMAELGFIVVQIDGRGTSHRSKSFQDESYGNYLSASNIDDHVCGIQQLADRYSYMDLDRVGISCDTSGGSSAIQGLLTHPNFFKVGVNYCAHDLRLESGAMVGEKYEGMTEPTYQFLENQIENLQGKLLLIHGFLDPILPVASTLRIVDALQKANKDFDLVLLPGSGHGVEINPYACRRAWDYFVKHLHGIEPPKEFQLALVAE